jgi:hypothetical protein
MKTLEPGAMAQACNPKLPGRQIAGGSWFETSPSKKRSHMSNQEKAEHSGACACHPSYTGSVSRRISSQADPSIKEDPHLKNKHPKRDSRVAQVVERLPRKYEAPSSAPSTAPQNLWNMAWFHICTNPFILWLTIRKMDSHICFCS